METYRSSGLNAITITNLISLIQTAEGALNETHSILQRMRELAVQSGNDTNTDTDRAELQKEVDQLSQALTDISDDTEFNTKKLLNGDFSEQTFHVGANEGQNIQLSIQDMDAEALGVVGYAGANSEVNGNSGVQVSNNSAEEVTIKFADLGAEAVSETTAAFDADTNTITVSLKQAAGADADTPATAATATQQEVLDALNTTGVVTATASTETDADALTDLATVGADTTAAAATKAAGGTLDTSKGINISSQTAADEAITTIQSAIDTVSAERSKLGAVQNRLDHTINNLGTSAENITAAESRIRDVDYDLVAA